MDFSRQTNHGIHEGHEYRRHFHILSVARDSLAKMSYKHLNRRHPFIQKPGKKAAQRKWEAIYQILADAGADEQRGSRPIYDRPRLSYRFHELPHLLWKYRHDFL